MVATPLADHAGRVTAALNDLAEAQAGEERLLHEARRIATQITHHQASMDRLRKQVAFVLAETHAAAGLT